MSEKPEFFPMVGAHLTNTQAQRYGEEMLSIKERNGQINTEIIFQEAAKGSVLGEYLYRNSEEEAIRLDRLSQAQYLLRSIGVKVGGRIVPFFWDLTEPKYSSFAPVEPEVDSDTRLPSGANVSRADRNYTTLAEAAQDDRKWAILVRGVRSRLSSAESTLQAVTEYGTASKAIASKAKREVKSAHQHVTQAIGQLDAALT